MALIGNSEPARNHGTMAIAGTRADVLLLAAERGLASVSATPYMPIANRSATARNQTTPVAGRVEVDAAGDARRRSARRPEAR